MNMKKFRKTWIVVAVAVLTIASVGLLGFSRTSAPVYTSTKVDRGNIQNNVEATGTINAVTSVQVGSQVSGTVSEILVDFNSKVKKGQIVARIDPSLFQGTLLQARADLADAQANLIAAKANLQKSQATSVQTRADLQRTAALAQEGVFSAQQLDLARSSADTNSAQVNASQAQVTQAAAQVQQKRAAVAVAQTNVDHTIIRAPIDGTVVSRTVDVGQTVAASLQAPTLFTIAQDLTKMQVYAKTDESDVGAIKPGQEVSFKVDAFPKQTFKGTVQQVRMNATTVQNVVTYDTIVNFDNPDTKLFPGMTAYVSIPVANATDVLKVTNAALRFQPSLPADGVAALLQKSGIKNSRQSDVVVVWKLDSKNSLEPVQVRTGVTDHATTELAQVLAGDLKVGDSLAIGTSGAKSASASQPSTSSPLAGSTGRRTK